MATFTATAATDDHSFAGTGNDFLYFQFDAYANAGDRFDGGAGSDTLQIRSSMVAHPPDGGAGFVATDEVYDFTGITFYSFEILSFYPMARMDMPGAVTFTSDQFGAGLLSNTLQLVGSDYSSTDVQRVTVNLAEGNSRFDASGWTFASFNIGTLPVRWTSGQDVIRLNGSAGDNLIFGTSQSDEIDGGAGRDTVSFAKAGGAVTVALAGTTTVVALVAGGNADILRNVEHLIGSAGADRLTGDAIANRLTGGAGVDTISGGAGKDVLTGGAGKDRLTGGTGADSFVFAASGFGCDTITDFTAGGAGHDVLRFDAAIFATRAAALAAASQSGADVVIHATQPTDSVVLKGVSLSDLTLGDFLII